MIDTVRGVLRVRKWPRKRGRPTSKSQRFWIDWFRQANLLAKYADPMSMARAILMTKGTGLYPRDVLLKAMRGRLYTWVDQDGWRWYPVAAIGDISETLDVLAQTVGSVLVRAADRWRAPTPGNFNDVLTYKDADNPPIWQASAGGGGITQEELAGTPIVPDGTQNSYDIDVTAYANIDLVLDGIAFAASDFPKMRYSIDGGATFKAGASDYARIFVTPTVQGFNLKSAFFMSSANSAAGHQAILALNSLRAGRATVHGGVSHTAAAAQIMHDHFTFNGPVTDIRIMSNAGNNFTAGAIRLVGSR